MTAAAWALQQAVYTALTADASVRALCARRVFDAVPKSAAFPYVVIGDADEQARGFGLIEHTLALHLWSRGSGCREIKQLAGALRSCLDGAILALNGQALIGLMVLSADYTRQSDGETWRGSVRLRAVTEPT